MTKVVLLHGAIAIALAAAMVVLPMGHILMAIPWIIVVAAAYIREPNSARGAFTLATYVAVTLSVIVAAVLAPVKTAERVLERTLVLPQTELTVAEMDREQGFESAQWLPRYVVVAANSGNANQRIRFRTTKITLREFIATIESQSELRHRFVHCGNSSSILFGGDCSFGLRLR